MQPGLFELRQYDALSLFPYKYGVASFKYERPGTYAFVVTDGFGYAIVFLSGAGGGGGSSDGVAGSEGGGGASGSAHVEKIRVRAGFKFVLTVPAGGSGAVFTGGPVGPGATGGAASVAVYDERGRLVMTISVPGGLGGDSTTGEASPGGAPGGVPSITISTIADFVTIFSQNGIAGDAGRTLGNDVGGYGGETHLKKFDPLEVRPRGTGGPVNNASGTAGKAPGSGGGGGVGAGSGGAGAPGVAWVVLLPVGD